ncbi:MAG: hypothetical protein ACLFR2_11200, partial [Candidatus Kapaibacterium sp.]
MKTLILFLSLAFSLPAFSQINYDILFGSSKSIKNVVINNQNMALKIQEGTNYNIYFSSNRGNKWDTVYKFKTENLHSDDPQFLFTDVAVGENDIFILADSLIKTGFKFGKNIYKFKSNILKSTDKGITWSR